MKKKKENTEITERQLTPISFRKLLNALDLSIRYHQTKLYAYRNETKK